jgi:hypothetical protein
MLLLNHVKNTQGIVDSAFDYELMTAIGSAVADLMLVGVSEFDGYSLTPESELPSFTDDTLKLLCLSYIHKKTKADFDPPIVGSVNKMFQDDLAGLLSKIHVQASSGQEEELDG